MESNNLVDRIYEAAIVPEMWESVVTEIADVLDTRCGCIFAQSAIGTSFIVTPKSRELFQRFAEEGWDRFNSRRERATALDHAGFLTDLDVFTEEELKNDPLYRDFFYPQGLGWSVGSHITTPNGDTLAVSFDGDYDKGPISREMVQWLDSIRPHLARALATTARLKTEIAAAMSDALGAFGLPTCVINARGKIIRVNKEMEPLIPDVISDRRSRATLRHLPSDRLLEKFCNGLTTMRHDEVMSIPVPAYEDKLPCVVHILPIRGHGRDIFADSLYILAVSQVSGSTLPTTSILRGLYDLTPTEAKVARFVANGVAPRDISVKANITANTVKAHLKSVYSKTGSKHYGSLVRLLSGMPMPLNGDS